ncbi:hepatocyte growth factor receptor-like [Branchiostoma floridae x Branchiostoma japonicum]
MASFRTRVFRALPLVVFVWLAAMVGLGLPLSCPDRCNCEPEAADCSGKGLTGIPEGFAESTQTVDLSRNKISRIRKGNFMGMDHLVSISLSKQERLIALTSKGTFQGLSDLRMLNLSANKLNDISVGVFDGLKNLRTLYLNDNSLRHLKPGLFVPLKKLQEISLENNHMATLTEDVFTKPLGGQLLMFLKGNEWVCDCAIKWLLSHTAAGGLSQTAYCVEPPQFRGKEMNSHLHAIVKCDENGQLLQEGSVFEMYDMRLVLVSAAGAGISVLGGVLFWVRLRRRKKSMTQMGLLPPEASCLDVLPFVCCGPTLPADVQMQLSTTLRNGVPCARNDYAMNPLEKQSKLDSVNCLRAKNLGLDDSFIEQLQGVFLDERLLNLHNQPLGEGSFGRVLKGELNLPGNDKIPIAIKTSKDFRTTPDLEKFLSEGLVMRHFKHPNIMNLLGVCMRDDASPLVVLPLMDKGDLLSVLVKSRKKTEDGKVKAESEFKLDELLYFAYQVACGMEYLAALQFVHRDLAARNCMVNSQRNVKVADFGFLIEIPPEKEVVTERGMGRVPIKWMSVESIVSGTFSMKSDVWSFGVVLWEIITAGAPPYGRLSNKDTMVQVKNGYRLPKPQHCPSELYDIMRSCWLKDASGRTDFESLVKRLELMLNKFTTKDAPPPNAQGGPPPLPPPNGNAQGGPPPLPPPNAQGGPPPLPPPNAQGGPPPLPPPNAKGGPPPNAKGGPPPNARCGPPPNAKGGPPPNARGGPPPNAKGGSRPKTKGGPNENGGPPPLPPPNTKGGPPASAKSGPPTLPPPNAKGAPPPNGNGGPPPLPPPNANRGQKKK